MIKINAMKLEIELEIKKQQNNVSYLQNNRNNMKHDHDAIELTPSIENVGLVAAKQAAYLDLGEHLDRERARAHEIDHVGEIHDEAVILERLGRVGTYGYERAESTRAHYGLHPRFVDPFHVDLRVYCIRVELLQLTQQVVRIERRRRQWNAATPSASASTSTSTTTATAQCVVVQTVLGSRQHERVHARVDLFCLFITLVYLFFFFNLFKNIF